MRGVGRRLVIAVLLCGAALGVAPSAASAMEITCGQQNPAIRACAAPDTQITYPMLPERIFVGFNLDTDQDTCLPLRMKLAVMRPDGTLTDFHQRRVVCGSPYPPPLYQFTSLYTGDGQQYGLYRWHLRVKGIEGDPPEYLSGASDVSFTTRLRAPPFPHLRCTPGSVFDVCLSRWVLEPDGRSHQLPAAVGETLAASIRVTDEGCSCEAVDVKATFRRPDHTKVATFAGSARLIGGVLEGVPATLPATQPGTYFVTVLVAPHGAEIHSGAKFVAKIHVV